MSFPLDPTAPRTLEGEPSDAEKMDVLRRLGSGVAHDLNNLLVVIRGYGELMLADQGLSERQRREITALRSAADRAAALTRQLTVFTRKQILVPTTLDVNDLVRSVEPMLRQIVSRAVRFTTILGEEAGHVLADPHDIEQLLANVTLAAANAMPTGGRLTIETTATTLDESHASAHAGVTPGRFVLISVSLAGIEPDHAVLGQPAEPPGASESPGHRTEIGLGFVPAMMQRLHGHLSVSVDGSGGAVFGIHLPRAEVEPAESPVAAAAPSPGMASTGDETILVVDDADEVRATLRYVLTPRGYTVLEADSGEEALRIGGAHDGPIQLLLCDLTLPGMSGPQVVKRFLESRPATRILFTSGHTGDEALRRGLIEEEQAFIPKPFTIDEIAKRIREVLDRA